MLEVDVAGLRTFYRRRGTGDALIFLHGILGDSRLWQDQLEHFAGDYSAIAPDLPGCGRSADPPESARFPEYADWLDGFIASLGLEEAHVAGLSWGGVLALELYRRHPSRVTSLTLADTYAGWQGSLTPEATAKRLTSCLRESEMAADSFIPNWMPGLVATGAPDSVREAIATGIRTFHPAGYRAMAHSVAEADMRDVLPTINVPTLLIWGEEDARSPLAVARDFAGAIPGARLVTLPGTGHMSNLESPGAFNAALRDFLRRPKA